jgi:hypothetical protein
MDKDNIIPNINSTAYSIIKKLSKINIFKYTIILFIFYTIISRFKLETQHVVAIQLGYLLVIFLINKDNSDFEIFVNKITYKLKFLNNIILLKNNIEENETILIDNNNIITNINNKSYLHHNPLIVNFLYKNKNYRYNNPSAYRQLIININNIIKLSRKQKYTKSNYDLLILYKQNSLNNLHSIIYKLDSSVYNNKKYQLNLKILNNLLLEYTDDFKNNINEDFKNNINIFSNNINNLEYIKNNNYDNLFNYF